jgi:hypothetical protein
MKESFRFVTMVFDRGVTEVRSLGRLESYFLGYLPELPGPQ